MSWDPGSLSKLCPVRTREDSLEGSLFELQRAGIRVSEDVAICGFDGIGWGQMTNPRLTILKQPLELIASTALDIISNPGAERREAILPVEFLGGQTT